SMRPFLKERLTSSSCNIGVAIGLLTLLFARLNPDRAGLRRRVFLLAVQIAPRLDNLLGMPAGREVPLVIRDNRPGLVPALVSGKRAAGMKLAADRGVDHV